MGQCAKNSNKVGANQLPQPPAVARWIDLGQPVIGNMFFTEAIQGQTDDCYFIAALSSVAWARPDRLRLYNEYYFNGQRTTLADQCTPVDANNNPIFARRPPSGEIWALLYEVAYAKWRSGNVNNRPNIAATIGNGGSGFRALKEVTGWQNPPNPYEPANQTTDQIWNSIATGAPVITGNYQCYKTSNPSFADTRDDVPGGVGIVSNHTYSLFGKINVTNTGTRYIVLRNPHGPLVAEPNVGVIQPNINFFGANLAQVADGVFAIEIERFRQYVLEYGSVVQ